MVTNGKRSPWIVSSLVTNVGHPYPAEKKSRIGAEPWLPPGTKKEYALMTKSLDLITEAVSNSKFASRRAENQPKKPQKHRYERRKIREFLHLADWRSADAA
jgi:hypothetical protein